LRLRAIPLKIPRARQNPPIKKNKPIFVQIEESRASACKKTSLFAPENGSMANGSMFHLLKQFLVKNENKNCTI